MKNTINFWGDVERLFINLAILIVIGFILLLVVPNLFKLLFRLFHGKEKNQKKRNN